MVDFEHFLAPRALDGYIKTIQQIAEQDTTTIQNSRWQIEMLVRSIYSVAYNLARVGIPLPPEDAVLPPIARISAALAWPPFRDAHRLVESLYEYQRRGVNPDITLAALTVPTCYLTSNQIGLASEISFFAKLVDDLQNDMSVESVTFLSTSARAIHFLFETCFISDGYLLEMHREKAVHHIARALDVIMSYPSIVEKISGIVDNLKRRHEKLAILTKEMAKEDTRRRIETID